MPSGAIVRKPLHVREASRRTPAQRLALRIPALAPAYARMVTWRRGHAGYRDWVSTWEDVWGEDLRLEPLELIDAGDRVVLLAQLHARGHGSGVALSWAWASVATLKNGRPTRDDVFNDHAQALAAAGLSD